MSTVATRQIEIVRYPQGLPEETDFRIANVRLPPLQDGELLLRIDCLSMDPFLRSLLAGTQPIPRPALGSAVPGTVLGTVLESRGAHVQRGAQVVCSAHWAEHAVVAESAVRVVEPGDFPASLHLGLLGVTGLTAWAALRCIAPPGPGQVVVIPAAAGGVGSLAGQLARRAGADVVGIAGSDEKLAYACRHLGYDRGVNHRAADFADALRAACPEGIDVYFDTVGGHVLGAVLPLLRQNARVVLCGQMAQYSTAERLPGPNLGPVIGARATLTGMVVHDHLSRLPDMQRELVPLLALGELHYREDVSCGLEAAPAAFCGMMRGRNLGKALVQVSGRVRA